MAPITPNPPRRQPVLDESISCPPKLSIEKSSVSSMKNTRFSMDLLKRSLNIDNSFDSNAEGVENVDMITFPDDTKQQRKNESQKKKNRSRRYRSGSRSRLLSQKRSSFDVLPVVEEFPSLEASSMTSLISDLTNATKSTWGHVVYSAQARMLRRFLVFATFLLVTDWALSYRASNIQMQRLFQRLPPNAMQSQFRRRVGNSDFLPKHPIHESSYAMP